MKLRTASSVVRATARGSLYALDTCGILACCALLRRSPGAIVMMYHSVADSAHAHWVDPRNHLDPHLFDEQMRYLSKNRTVIPLNQLIQTIRSGQSCEPGTVVITFDDGYLDNLTQAAPILARYDLPATLFLPTGQIDRGETQWIDMIYSSFQKRTCHDLLPVGPLTRIHDLRDEGDCAAAYNCLCQCLLESCYADRADLLIHIQQQLQPSELPPRLTMNWDDVRELLVEYPQFEVGGHTVNHTDMSQLDSDKARQELHLCRDRMQEEIGRQSRHLSFPYGRSSDSLRRLAKEVGFESAFGGGKDPLIRGTTNRYALRRVAAPASNRRIGFLTSSSNSGLLHRIAR